MLWKLIHSSVFSSVLSGVLLALAFNNSKLWIFTWFAFVPLFFALNNKSLKKTAGLFFITGFIFWSSVIYWLVNVTFLGTILLILYLTLYFVVFGLIIRPLTRKSQFSILLFIPSVWVLLEHVRSHLLTGFPWALLGYSQYLNLPVIQIADIFGTWGISFLIIFVNAAIVEIIWLNKTKLFSRLKITVISVVLVLFSVLFYGCLHLSSDNSKLVAKDSVRISVVQGNIPQESKWNFSSRDMIMRSYFKLTSYAVKDNPDLIIWPEAALPVVLEEEPEYYHRTLDYINSINKPLLFGAVTTNHGFYYNSAILVSGDAKFKNKYDKLHLVPFGEFIPFRNTLKFLDTIAPIGDITRGREYVIFHFPVNFGVLICFEDVFPELARNFTNKGARFLVNITNDAWFGKTPEAYQHLAASVLRAVENRVFVVRAANTGVSAFISSHGRIVSSVNSFGKEIFIPGYATDKVGLSDSKRSFYGHFGDWFIFACLIFILYVLMFRVIKK
jgi:apolipoprotein N-acyltransferase